MTIENKINLTIKEFYNQKWKKTDFLTEDDIRCRLFYFLHLKLKEYKNISIHSEIRWYGKESKKLTYRSDIVILNNESLSINNRFQTSSKGYNFNTYYAVIEIKLRRVNNKNSDIAYNKIIQNDIEKLKKIVFKTTLKQKDNYVIAFDQKRKQKLCQLVSNENNNLNWEVWND